MYAEDNYGDWQWWQQAHGIEFDDGWTADDEPEEELKLTPEQALFQWEVMKDLSKLDIVE